MEEKLLKNEEKAIFALRSCYRKFGYLPFKMSKFEEYDLYLKNKDFLVSDRVITFNDTNGKLMALKPDVTLSILKNGEDEPGVKQKVYYNENVYRVSDRTHRYKEIMQVGLECIGDVDFYDIVEVVTLAAKSLAMISDSYVLDISHLGLLSAFLDETEADESTKWELASCVAGKNAHDLMAVCEKNGISKETARKLCKFIGIYGDMNRVTEELEPLCCTENSGKSLAQLKRLSELLCRTEFASHIRFDFSVVNDMKYYNGFVFKGYLAGICEGVLSGGQYDNLMRRMGRKSKAVGFALYLDLLEELEKASDGYDVDCLILYDRGTKTEELMKTVRTLTGSGKTVSAQKAVPKQLRYRELTDLRKGESRD